jgi:hypothetical protein
VRAGSVLRKAALALQDLPYEAQRQFHHLVELTVQDDGVARVLHPVHLGQGGAHTFVYDLTAGGGDGVVQATLDHEKGLVDPW